MASGERARYFRQLAEDIPAYLIRILSYLSLWHYLISVGYALSGSAITPLHLQPHLSIALDPLRTFFLWVGLL